MEIEFHDKTRYAYYQTYEVGILVLSQSIVNVTGNECIYLSPMHLITPFYNTSQKNVEPKMTPEPHAFFAGKVLALSALCSYSPALTL
jgi:hypothetical protein